MMRIGIIGSGIAGLVAARNLQRDGHQVTLLERQTSVGLDAHSIDLPLESEAVVSRADVPSRMFNQQGWPSLFQLYQEIGIQSVPVSMTQSFSLWHGSTYLNLEHANRTESMLAAIPGTRKGRMLRQAIRLRDLGQQDLSSDRLFATTLRDYLTENRFSEEFLFEFLYPTLSSTVCTCSFESLDQYPAITILTILDQLTSNAKMLRSRFGTQDVARRLLDDRVDLQLDTKVDLIERHGNEIAVLRQGRQLGLFDHLIVATQANTARHLLPENEGVVRDLLSNVKYETISVAVHQDRRFMPEQERHWATFNMQISPDRTQAMCTVWLNRFHDQWKSAQPVFQTINAFEMPQSETVMGQWELQRPVVNLKSRHVWESLERLNQQADRRIWLCGSYAGRGTPLLESGVVSANAVSRAIQEAVLKVA